MSRSFRFAAFFVLATLVSPAFTPSFHVNAGSGPASPSVAAGQEDLLPLSEVRPGMKFVIRTVMRGDVVEELPGEVLGVMENSLGPSQSLILARLDGERASFTGVAAGMSGSPVYADGKLMGALSYRIGSFMKEPIAAITPIEYMLDLAKISEPPAAPRTASSAFPVSQPIRGPGPTIPLRSSFGISVGVAGAGAEAALIPIETPLVLTGVPGSVSRIFAPVFETLGGVAVTGAGGNVSGAVEPGRKVRPGDAIAAQLVRGDISVAATGTVTYVEGERILAFGHPFLLQGAADLPMARAEIYTTLASMAGSSKLSRIRETIGSWEQIRLTGISGVTSKIPQLIPVSVTVKTPTRSTSYSYEVATHRDWSPTLVAICVASSLVNTPAFTDESTLKVKGRVRLDDHPDVVLEDLYTALGGGPSAAVEVAQDVQGIFAAVFQNRFVTPQVRSIDLTAEGIEEGKLAFVEGVWPSRTEAMPGDEVYYHVRLRSFRGGVETKTFTFRVPAETPRGDLQVMIGGAAFLQAAERQLLSRRIAGADDLDQIIGVVNSLRASDALYARAVRRLSGAVVQSEVLPALPPSVLTTIRSNRGSGDVAPLAESAVWEDRLASTSIVAGGATVALKIR